MLLPGRHRHGEPRVPALRRRVRLRLRRQRLRRRPGAGRRPAPPRRRPGLRRRRVRQRRGVRGEACEAACGYARRATSRWRCRARPGAPPSGDVCDRQRRGRAPRRVRRRRGRALARTRTRTPRRRRRRTSEEINLYGAFVLIIASSSTPIDATPARWRGDAGSSASLPCSTTFRAWSASSGRRRTRTTAATRRSTPSCRRLPYNSRTSPARSTRRIRTASARRVNGASGSSWPRRRAGKCRVDPVSKCLEKGNCVCNTDDFGGGAGLGDGVLFHVPVSVTARDIAPDSLVSQYQEAAATPAEGTDTPTRATSRFSFRRSTSREHCVRPLGHGQDADLCEIKILRPRLLDGVATSTAQAEPGRPRHRRRPDPAGFPQVLATTCTGTSGSRAPSTRGPRSRSRSTRAARRRSST